MEIKILISIIIPVYNKEEYLDRCLASVCKQTYNNIEIIIVNDGSTDSSGKIVSKWENLDSRIKYIEQKNHGVSVARNNGMQLSKGEYIYFVDADDSITSNAIETLVKKISDGNKVDIVVANYSRVINNKVIKRKSINDVLLTSTDLRFPQVKADLFLVPSRPLASACNKLYKTAFIKSNNVTFKSDVLAEDRLFNLMCYINQPEILLINEYTYLYNVLDNTRSRKFAQDRYKQIFALFYKLESYMKFKGCMKEYGDLLEYNMLYEIDNLLQYYYKYSNSNLSSIKEAVKLLRNDKRVFDTIKAIHTKNILNKINVKRAYTMRMRTLIYLILYTPNSCTALFYWIYLSLGKIRRRHVKLNT